MPRTLLPALALSLALSLPLATAAAERVALIIGTNKYPTHPLDNAVNDANAVAHLLKSKLGFTEEGAVVMAIDLDKIQLFEKIETFKKQLPDAKIALIFYAGHGMETLDGKENYLLPSDADPAKAADSEAYFLAMGVNVNTLVVDIGKKTTAAKIVLLDCCRERPAKRASVAGGGLATYEDIPADTLMIFGVAPEKLASDGRRHGPFTEALLEVLPKQGKTLMDAFFEVSDQVKSNTKGDQVPWFKFDGTGKIFRDQSFLARGNVVPDPPKPPVMLTAADRLRAATKDAPFVNSLGLEFVPVPGKNGVFMCRTETRVRDFRAYAEGEDYTQSGGAYVLKVNKTPEGGYTTAWELDSAASWEKPGFAQSEDHPVVCVSWLEARAFCEWLSKQEKGLTYRLPSDAEWSAAVGSIGKYPWGSAWPPPKGAGNYAGPEYSKNFPGKGWPKAYDHDDGAERTARVGLFTENRFGFFDLGGNVWEWCEDEYRASMNDADALEQIPVLKTEKDTDGTPFRVVRGGSWYYNSEIYLRSSSRGSVRPAGRSGNYGFRLVVVVGGVGG